MLSRVARWFPLALLLVAGCYNPDIAGGALGCAPGGKCPEGYQCFPDNRCYKMGANPDCNPACAGQMPVCDKSTLKCVGCLGDKDCPTGFVCAAAMKTCRPGCNAGHSSCEADAGLCDVDAGVCRGC